MFILFGFTALILVFFYFLSRTHDEYIISKMSEDEVWLYHPPFFVKKYHYKFDKQNKVWISKSGRMLNKLGLAIAISTFEEKQKDILTKKTAMNNVWNKNNNKKESAEKNA